MDRRSARFGGGVKLGEVFSKKKVMPEKSEGKKLHKLSKKDKRKEKKSKKTSHAKRLYYIVRGEFDGFKFIDTEVGSGVLFVEGLDRANQVADALYGKEATIVRCSVKTGKMKQLGPLALVKGGKKAWGAWQKEMDSVRYNYRCDLGDMCEVMLGNPRRAKKTRIVRSYRDSKPAVPPSPVSEKKPPQPGNLGAEFAQDIFQGVQDILSNFVREGKIQSVVAEAANVAAKIPEEKDAVTDVKTLLPKKDLKKPVDAVAEQHAAGTDVKKPVDAGTDVKKRVTPEEFYMGSEGSGNGSDSDSNHDSDMSGSDMSDDDMDDDVESEAPSVD